MSQSIFTGTMPALMTPCKPDRTPDFDALVKKGKEMIAAGMSAVVYCGSMGDWPLLSDAERMEGVERLITAGLPVVVGTGAINSKSAVALAAHAQKVGAAGLMVIPRVLSRGSSIAAQRNHFKAILSAAPDIPAIIYNSPVYGFATRADLFLELRADHPNLVGFKEFGGKSDLRYAAEHITSKDDQVTLMVGVDTEVYHGFVNCGATGSITGIGTALPKEALLLAALCQKAAAGHAEARLRARELEEAFGVLASFDEGTDLVLYYKHLLVLNGEEEYRLHFNETDELTDAQRNYCEQQYHLFRTWFADWSSQGGVIAECM
ncbi:dihydrodipicolinate synthase family protein [Ruegeria sp. NA]|nr:dihydrodipicolinate synthase family protein [Ruegeria sp. NA]MCX8954905.1 dihydrodipicolinate synthase family protein [Ruegeria sp. NA]